MTFKVKVKVTQGQKSILYSNFLVLQGEFDALNRMTLRLKVKVIEGQKSTLYLNFRVFKGELNANDRMTLKVIVKVIEGQMPVLERCENSPMRKGVWGVLTYIVDGECLVIEYTNDYDARAASFHGAFKIWGLGASPNFWRIFKNVTN